MLFTTCAILTILQVQYASAQLPRQSADPLDSFNIDALLAELGPLPGAPAPSGPSNPGNLGSAVADISTQTGASGNPLDLEAAIQDIQKELRQTFASDASLQGLVAGSSGDLGNFDALFGSLGGEASSSVTSGNNGGLGVAGGSRSTSASSAKSQSSLAGKVVNSKLPPLSTRPVASQNTIEKFDRRPAEPPKDALMEMSLPNIGELSLDQPPPPPPQSEIPSLNSFAPLHGSFSRTAGSESAARFQQTSALPSSLDTFGQSASSVASQLPDIKLPESSFPLTNTFETGSSVFGQSSSSPESSFPLTASLGTGSTRFGQSAALPESSFPLTSSFETGSTTFGQGSSALAEQLKNLAQGSGTFGFPSTQPQQTASSPSRRQLENLTPDELRRALAEVNKEIDILSRPIKDNTPTSSGSVTSVLPGELPGRSESLIGLEAGSIAQRFGERTGLESAFLNEASIGNSFELPQLDSRASTAGRQTASTSAGTDQSPAQQLSGPEGQQFVTAAPPQINPLNALENVGGGLPFAPNPFLPGMQPMFGRPPMFGQAPSMFGLPSQGQFFQGSGQLPQNFGQGQRGPGLISQQPSFLNTNRLQFDEGSISGGLRSGLPNLRFELPTGSPVRTSPGARESEFQFEQRGRPETVPFGADALRGRGQSNREDLRRGSSNSINRERSQDRDINRIMSSIREQRLRGNFDLGSLRQFSDRSRGGTSHLDGATRLRLNGVTIRRHTPPEQDRRTIQHRTGRNPVLRRQNFRSMWG